VKREKMDDDWELSAEQLEFLERDAFRQIAQRNSSSSAAVTSSSSGHSSQPPLRNAAQPVPHFAGSKVNPCFCGFLLLCVEASIQQT